MSYKHPQLPHALSWKHPGKRIDTVEGVLTQTTITPVPSDIEQAQCVTDYGAYVASSQSKDDEWQAFLDSKAGKGIKTLALVGIEKGLWTAAELRTKYRSLV